MTYRDNIKAIIETNFIGLSEEYIEGVCAKICELQTDKSYEDGLNDAWECARKIVFMPSEGGLTAEEMVIIFNHDNVMKNYTASEAIAKIKEYEDKQKKIRPNCSYLKDICPYNIKCVDCEVFCSIKRGMDKVKELKGDKE